ncbi:MAG: hypothetical protein JNL79_13250 [Myxococcales bacterium]|nr:hypothetical protein [Myxococcales bacterium]
MRALHVLGGGVLLAFLPSLVTVASVGCSSSETPAAVTGPCADGGAIVRLGSFTDEACLAFVEAEQRKQVVSDPTRAPQWSGPPAGKLSGATPPTFTWSKGTLAARFSLVAAAHAHGNTTGDAYVLTFRDAAGKELLRVMTTNLGFAPDAATWARLAVAKSLVVSLVGARYTSNALSTGVAPTAQADRAFTVE